jgi:IPT/TIG domain
VIPQFASLRLKTSNLPLPLIFYCSILVSLLLLLLAAPARIYAGGPKYVAGVGYFNPSVLGQPVVWPNGQVPYFVDQGALGPLSHAQTVQMVDSAAAIWSQVPTAAVNLVDEGPLAEDVNGNNVQAVNSVFTAPADITPNATTTPVAVIFDTDGSVIDALEGAGASQPDNCSQNGVLVWLDNLQPDATLAHGVIVLNGRCAATANLQAMMSYQLERAFGRILGLDFSQVNDNAQANTATEYAGEEGWPIMDPLSGSCGPQGGTCMPNPGTLRLDDIAALNRLYPVTAANLASFPGKTPTAANTVSIQGTIVFRSGQGMQGVNVVARPLDANGNPLYQYAVTFVSGSYFAGNRGNPVTGFTDALGNRLDRFGSSNPALQGFFDLGGIPLPPGMTSASYQLSFESVNPLYIDAISVGPYLLGSPAISGAAPAITVNNLAAGSAAQALTVTVANSAYAANSPSSPSIGSESKPAQLPASGSWTSRLGRVGASDWLIFPVKGNRIFTVVAQALDETGTPSWAKAMPAIGVWDGFDPTGIAAAGGTQAANGTAPGETWLQVATAGNDTVRLAIADQRGDGRPDYLYRGWVLYADTVSPARVPASGGQIVIRGFGFRAGDTVQVGGVPAQVASIFPNEITAIVPAAAAGQTGSLDVEVDDQPIFYAKAIIPSGLSYDSGAADSLHLVSAPSNQVPMNVPQPFAMIAQDANGNPAGGVTVTWQITSGTATLGCGQATCSVTAGGDGRATLPITATSSAIAVVTASLTNGVSLQAHFYGGAPPAINALTPTLYLAGGATTTWPVQALLLSAGNPLAGQQITWQGATGIVVPGSPVASNASGIAAANLTVGPLAEGQSVMAKACLAGTQTCAAFTVFGSRPEFASLAAVSGTGQSLSAAATPAPVILRVLDMNGNPMAGGTVVIHQTLRSLAPPCPSHGRCAQPFLLATQSATLTSALDGTVTFTPLNLPGIATNLAGLAATGNNGSLAFTVEQHP